MGLFVFNEPHPVSSFCMALRRNKLALFSGVPQVGLCLTSPSLSLLDIRYNYLTARQTPQSSAQKPGHKATGKGYLASSQTFSGPK